MQYDERYMRRALELAARGRGNTSPNPMVGAVIVGPDGRIIGEGYHRKCGSGHAEVNAVASVADRSLLRHSTMYVTLEPCSHYGKTPPCAKLIIDCGIPRVVVGAADPFPEVSGRGIAMLRDAGIEVVQGVLADESRRLNAVFMTAHEKQRPYITLKWAQSADGFIDSDRPDGKACRFSTPVTTLMTHRLRAEHDAILVGSGTVLADKPRLNVRLNGLRNPQPVILDRRGRLRPGDITTELPPIILSDYPDLHSAMHSLYGRGITSVLVEGGRQVLQSFIDAGLYDQVRVEVAPCRLGPRGTVPAPVITGLPARTVHIVPNRLLYYPAYGRQIF